MYPHQNLDSLKNAKSISELPENIGNALTCLYLEVFTRDGIIKRKATWGETIYGSWDAVLNDIKRMDFYVNVIIKVY